MQRYCEEKLNDAVKLLARALEINSTYVPAIFTLGEIFRSRKQFDLALMCYNAAKKLDPTQPMVLTAFVNAYAA